jgi:enoyl-CoA hydratase/carnithine racemase
MKVLAEADGPVLTVTLNRPDKLNALDTDCLDLLERHFAAADSDPAVRVVVLAGNGRGFCAGADLAVVAGIAADRGAFDAFLLRWHTVFGVIEACGKPTIAAVTGVALAGGFELTQVCDLVVMGASARLGDQHANFGLFPGGGSTQRLPRLIGRRAAAWMLLSGDPVDASTALELGLANRVAPDDDVLHAARDMALYLAERSTAASRAIKRSLREGIHLPLADALDVERGIAVEHMASIDAATGLAAFDGRTQPDFGYRRPAEAGQP